MWRWREGLIKDVVERCKLPALAVIEAPATRTTRLLPAPSPMDNTDIEHSHYHPIANQ